jgi:TonB family protein
MAWRFWLELLLRSTLLLSAGAALLKLSQKQPAAFRHKLLLWVFALLALLPVMNVLFPEIHLPSWQAEHSRVAAVTVQQLSSRIVNAPTPTKLDLLAWIWLSGAVCSLAPLLAGYLAVSRIARASTPFRDSDILISRTLPVPLTFGILRPRILLPEAARDWPVSRLRAVLAHERAHIQRRDLAAQIAVHFVCACWWFQPLVWLLRNRLRAASEMACDADAIRNSFLPSEYAAELLGVAQAIGKQRLLASFAIGMARVSGLEERMRALLNPAPAIFPRVRSRAIGFALAAAGIASAMSITPQSTSNQQGGLTMKRTIMSALLASAGLSAATISGQIHDAAGSAVSDAKISLNNPDSGAKWDAVSDADGRFSLDTHDAGQYVLRIEKPGFNPIFRAFDLKADAGVGRIFTLNPAGQADTDDVNTSEDNQKSIRIGGRVAQANLTTKVQPVYPTAAKSAGVQGVVEMEATISKDGVPVELRVVSSPSSDLSESALEAVRQWRYRPTLLNGQPVEIVTTVVVNYTLAK